MVKLQKKQKLGRQIQQGYQPVRRIQYNLGFEMVTRCSFPPPYLKMGSSTSTSQLVDMTNQFIAQAYLSSSSSCAASANVQQIINVGCSFSPQEQEAKANSLACQNCQA